jgi:hypothetical protein
LRFVAAPVADSSGDLPLHTLDGAFRVLLDNAVQELNGGGRATSHKTRKDDPDSIRPIVPELLPITEKNEGMLTRQ